MDVSAAEKEATCMHGSRLQDESKFYLVGGGIASLAAAFFIRDGDITGRNIEILEESSRLGGSLDAAGSPIRATPCVVAG